VRIESENVSVTISEEIAETLRRIAALLGQYGLTDWQRTFLEFTDETQMSPERAMSQVRRVYGGMGSFNDIILQRPNGSMPTEDNDEFYLLRHRLFELCMESRARPTDQKQ
jgi:hypothetical protein